MDMSDAAICEVAYLLTFIYSSYSSILILISSRILIHGILFILLVETSPL